MKGQGRPMEEERKEPETSTEIPVIYDGTTLNLLAKLPQKPHFQNLLKSLSCFLLRDRAHMGLDLIV